MKVNTYNCILRLFEEIGFILNKCNKIVNKPNRFLNIFYFICLNYLFFFMIRYDDKKFVLQNNVNDIFKIG